jgi:hypothetical protein
MKNDLAGEGSPQPCQAMSRNANSCRTAGRPKTDRGTIFSGVVAVLGLLVGIAGLCAEVALNSGQKSAVSQSSASQTSSDGAEPLSSRASSPPPQLPERRGANPLIEAIDASVLNLVDPLLGRQTTWWWEVRETVKIVVDTTAAVLFIEFWVIVGAFVLVARPWAAGRMSTPPKGARSRSGADDDNA